MTLLAQHQQGTRGAEPSKTQLLDATGKDYAAYGSLQIYLSKNGSHRQNDPASAERCFYAVWKEKGLGSTDQLV